MMSIYSTIRTSIFSILTLSLLSCSGGSSTTPFDQFPTVMHPVAIASQSTLTLVTHGSAGEWVKDSNLVGTIPCSEYFDELPSMLIQPGATAYEFVSSDSVRLYFSTNPSNISPAGHYRVDDDGYRITLQSVFGGDPYVLHARQEGNDLIFTSLAYCLKKDGGTFDNLLPLESPDDTPEERIIFDGDTLVYRFIEVRYSTLTE